MHSDLNCKYPILIPCPEQLLANESRQSNETALSIMTGRLMQTTVPTIVAMEHIAIKLKKHFQCTVLVVSKAAEHRGVALVVGSFDEVLMDTEFTKHGGKLTLPVCNCMMKCVSATLILNDQ